MVLYCIVCTTRGRHVFFTNTNYYTILPVPTTAVLCTVPLRLPGCCRTPTASMSKSELLLQAARALSLTYVWNWNLQIDLRTYLEIYVSRVCRSILLRMKQKSSVLPLGISSSFLRPPQAKTLDSQFSSFSVLNSRKRETKPQVVW